MKQRTQTQAVQENEEHYVDISGMGEKGDGMCKINGMVVFVKNTKVGDTVRIRIYKVLEKVAFGEVLK